jgi:hypothetical protein
MKDMGFEAIHYGVSELQSLYGSDPTTHQLNHSHLISHLDLVVSLDTSVAHLAGALAKRVWVLLTDVPDWRLEREDTPGAKPPLVRAGRYARLG